VGADPAPPPLKALPTPARVALQQPSKKNQVIGSTSWGQNAPREVVSVVERPAPPLVATKPTSAPPPTVVVNETKTRSVNVSKSDFPSLPSSSKSNNNSLFKSKSSSSSTVLSWAQLDQDGQEAPRPPVITKGKGKKKATVLLQWG
jgi:hypothetical protein